MFFQVSDIHCASSNAVGGECATLQIKKKTETKKKPGFCLAPKLLSAAEFSFSHLTLHCLFFHSPGVEH